MAGIAIAVRTLNRIYRVTRLPTMNTTRRYTTMEHDIFLPCSSRAPWLRLPADIVYNQMLVNYDNFLNIVDKRLVKVGWQGQFESNTICIGSARDMLAYLSQSGSMYFASPYNGHGRRVRFYNDLISDDPKDDYLDYGNLHSSTRGFTKVGDVLTVLYEPRHDPDSPTPNCYNELFVCWPENWFDWSKTHHLFHKEDPPIVYCDADKTVYKLYRDSNQRLWVELWDMSKNHIKIRAKFNVGPSSSNEGLLALLPSDMENQERELRMRCHQDRYLVVTGDSGKADPVLYLVVRHHNRELGVSQTRAVDVFRVDLNLGSSRMIYTTKLDDHAFFIGTGSDSFAIPVDQCPELKRDSIYVADDLRVYDLKDGSISPIVDMGDLSVTRFQAFWLYPPSQEQIKESTDSESYENTVSCTK